MQAPTNAATTAAPVVFTKRASAETPNRVIQIVLIKQTEAAVYLVFKILVFLL